MQRHAGSVTFLAVTQILSWGSLYYAFSILAPSIGRELNLRPELLYGAFSVSILIAGLASAPVGMCIDRFGGRWLMASGSLVCGSGMLWLASAGSAASYVAAWALLGIGMALSLYEAAFATITRRVPAHARRAISTITLVAGFASTVFWPMTAHLHEKIGWRLTYTLYAAMQFGVCLPLHILLGREDGAPGRQGEESRKADSTLAQVLRLPAFWSLTAAFATNAFIFSAMSVHLIPLIADLGHASHLAVFLAALIGPMQVVGRLIERSGAQNLAPQTIGRFTFAGLPAALLILAMYGQQAWAVSMFCVLYGLTNGVLTILRGTLPQALFGTRHYGAIAGAMAGPALLAKAAGPVLVALALNADSARSWLLWAMLGLAAVSYCWYVVALRQGLKPVGSATALIENQRSGAQRRSG